MINIVDNLLSADDAKTLIDRYCKKDNLGNKEIPNEDIWVGSPLYKLLEKVKPNFESYAHIFPVKRHIYFDKVVAIKNDNGEGQEHPMHFDQSISIEDGLSISAFVTLIYLNDDFSGGQLYFPFQNQVIQPITGRMLMFPTGPMYSHKIFPFYGKPRYLLRIFHVFNSELEGKDKDDLITRLNVKQEKKEL